MRSYLLLNTPGEPATSASFWSFSGADDWALRSCLERLDEYVVTNQNGRWQSPVVYGIRGEGKKYGDLPEPITFERAWNVEGARTLTGLLPERFVDVREELIKRFGEAGSRAQT